MRIGIFRACGIGDAAQLTPLFQQIAADYPASQIDFFTSKNVTPVLASHPLLARCITLPNEALQRQSTPLGSWRVWQAVSKAGPWDLFLDFSPFWVQSMFFRRVRARRSAGFTTEGWKPWRLYTHEMKVERDARLHRDHVSLYYLRLWEHLTGFADRGFGYDLQYLRRQFSDPLPAGLTGPFVCLAPGAGNFLTAGEVKRWPAANWVRLSHALAAAGYSPVWLGAPEDRHILETAGAQPAGLDLVGRVSLQETMHILSRSQGIIANDSGLFHIALGLDVPAVGFYGPTDPGHVGPFRNRRALVLQERLACVPCRQNECTVQDPQLAHLSRPHCLHLLTPEIVLPRVLEFLVSVSSPAAEPLSPSRPQNHSA